MRTFLEYASAMVGCYAAMPEHERQQLHEWEAENLGVSGDVGTSDWPGWQKYIGHFQPEAKKTNTFGYVYLIQCSTGECKIGSSRSIARRFQQLQSANPNLLSILHYFPSENSKQDEYALHKAFGHKRIRNEWFALSGEDIKEICAIEFRGAQQNAQRDGYAFGVPVRSLDR